MRLFQGGTSFVDLLCFCSVLCLLCICVRLFICALWSPAGKGLTSWLSFVVSAVSLSLSHWYPGSGVVLDCIDSWSLHPYLLCMCNKYQNFMNWHIFCWFLLDRFEVSGIFPYISLMVRENPVKIFHNSYRVFFHSIWGQSVPVLTFTTRISNLCCGSTHLLTTKRKFGYNCDTCIIIVI